MVDDGRVVERSLPTHDLDLVELHGDALVTGKRLVVLAVILDDHDLELAICGLLDDGAYACIELSDVVLVGDDDAHEGMRVGQRIPHPVDERMRRLLDVARNAACLEMPLQRQASRLLGVGLAGDVIPGRGGAMLAPVIEHAWDVDDLAPRGNHPQRQVVVLCPGHVIGRCPDCLQRFAFDREKVRHAVVGVQEVQVEFALEHRKAVLSIDLEGVLVAEQRRGVRVMGNRTRIAEERVGFEDVIVVEERDPIPRRVLDADVGVARNAEISLEPQVHDALVAHGLEATRGDTVMRGGVHHQQLPVGIALAHDRRDAGAQVPGIGFEDGNDDAELRLHREHGLRLRGQVLGARLVRVQPRAVLPLVRAGVLHEVPGLGALHVVEATVARAETDACGGVEAIETVGNAQRINPASCLDAIHVHGLVLEEEEFELDRIAKAVEHLDFVFIVAVCTFRDVHAPDSRIVFAFQEPQQPHLRGDTDGIALACDDSREGASTQSSIQKREQLGALEVDVQRGICAARTLDDHVGMIECEEGNRDDPARRGIGAIGSGKHLRRKPLVSRHRIRGKPIETFFLGKPHVKIELSVGPAYHVDPRLHPRRHLRSSLRTTLLVPYCCL